MSGTTADTGLSAYLNSLIYLASNTMVVPEVGYFDGKEDGFGNTQDKTYYAGAKRQINF